MSVPIYKPLDFRPLLGFSSPHLQMMLASYGAAGKEPLSNPILIPIGNGDQLSCQMTTPKSWKETDPTVAFVHGLGGSHSASYLIRLARKFSQLGFKVVRVNLRNCGSGVGLSKLPYNAGTSQDILAVIQHLFELNPESPLTLIGFSLGGNLILKMAGELGAKAPAQLKRLIAVCPVINLATTERLISLSKHWLYHRYYLLNLLNQTDRWVKGEKISSIYEFDEKITAAYWGYANAIDYYNKASSRVFIPNIQVPCDLVMTADDPFIDYRELDVIKVNPSTNVYLSQYGSHMGFIGWAGNDHGLFWMDKVLIQLALQR